MAKNKWVVFDFDGTITEYAAGIFSFYNEHIAAPFKSRRLEPEDWDTMKSLSISEKMKFVRISIWHAPLIVRKCRKNFPEIISRLTMVEGLREACEELKAQGYKLAIISTNKRSNIEIYMKNNKIEHLFDSIFCDRGPFLSIKHRTIRRMMKKMKLTNKDIVYVGDETRDVVACRKIGVPAVSVTWGWESREVLAKANDKLADTPEEMVSYVREFV